MTPTKETCGECKYYYRVSETSGHCCGNPPIPTPGGFSNRGGTVGVNAPGCHLWRPNPALQIDTATPAGQQELKAAVQSAVASGQALPAPAGASADTVLNKKYRTPKQPKATA